jgi:hypothetical protein
MAGELAGTDLVCELNTLFQFGVVGDLSDAQLLHRFLIAPDGVKQWAFTALVDAARSHDERFGRTYTDLSYKEGHHAQGGRRPIDSGTAYRTH